LAQGLAAATLANKRYIFAALPPFLETSHLSEISTVQAEVAICVARKAFNRVSEIVNLSEVKIPWGGLSTTRSIQSLALLSCVRLHLELSRLNKANICKGRNVESVDTTSPSEPRDTTRRRRHGL
jgi:hypothetical protein